ncbi:Golgin subfamily A member 7/ERF4 [Fimicolochytrium jonesii]|uniref:Golgin subfamily A member 7/ERF4 n=1 Tax=Fimicolochytrium jonesii TaxID=1396493 RepID=UPI0022FE9A77|nr:Golgin subfamily A member 7/ERF4 [Fimicolochytrium jonesii]KAI8817614.1 Golgin subfamily A member 7/ERF4 [Fimicolochytrium jonesii]
MEPPRHPTVSCHPIHGTTLRTIHINRTYDHLDTPQFALDFPQELAGKLSPSVLKTTVSRINGLLLEAGAVSGSSFLQNCLACASCFVTDLFVKSRMEKDPVEQTLQVIADFVEQENHKHYRSAGLQFLDPRKTGLMHLEILIK